ncbi:MAG: pseudopilin PulG [Verrucomicrobia bacterium]|nr:MAG: pseudopilin PulG [Verrucomicrobiota bacterium]
MRIHSCERRAAFTLIELMVVIGILCSLMTMVLGVQKYAQTKSKRSRTETQIAGFSAAAEAYRSDNGTYPRGEETDGLGSVGESAGATTSTAFLNSNLAFYVMLTGDANRDGKPDSAGAGAAAEAAQPAYMNFSPSQLFLQSGRVSFMQDPWGKAFGYSTKRSKAIQAGADDPLAGHNVTFDVWSTANMDDKEKAWISNW